MTKGPISDFNFNAGLYEADENKIIFRQWIHLHLRPGDHHNPIQIPDNPTEKASYKLSDDKLVITFPSNNRFILERIPE